MFLKAVEISGNSYAEGDYREETAEERTLLLPRTKRGKPKKLSAVTLTERRPFGMYLRWEGRFGNVLLGCADTQQTYDSSRMDGLRVESFTQFRDWLDRWTADTTPADRAEAAAFCRRKRQHAAYREGDFFRFRAGRRQYGYGRILLDYDRMRREKQPFWDILMGKPLVVKVYHLITEDPDFPPEHPRTLPALPSQFLMDNRYYLRCDLRNPAYRLQLENVCRQFGLTTDDLHIRS